MDKYKITLNRNEDLIEMLTHVVARVTMDIAKKADGLGEYENTAQGLELHTKMTREVIEHELIRQYGV